MVLVSILGDFDSSIVPVFFEMKDKLSKHIIIYDDAKYDGENLKRVLKGQEKISSLYNLEFEIITLKIDEDSYDDVIGCYNAIIKHSKREYEKIYLNGTDGLVSSVVIIANRLINLGANFIAYDRFDNQCNIITKESMQKIMIGTNNTIETHLIQKGYDLDFMYSDVTLKSRKKSIYKLCEDLEHFQSFANATHGRRPSEVHGFEDFKEELEKIGQLNSVPFIQGGVFEEYIYWLIKDNCDFDDVMVGVKVQIEEGVSNEFDILMIKNNHLHTIECKLRRKVPGEEYVYKLDSLIHHLDDDGKAMLLVIGGENERMNSKGVVKKQFSLGTKARAREAQIKIHHQKIFDKQKFLNDLSEHFLIQGSK